MDGSRVSLVILQHMPPTLGKFPFFSEPHAGCWRLGSHALVPFSLSFKPSLCGSRLAAGVVRAQEGLPRGPGTPAWTLLLATAPEDQAAAWIPTMAPR